MSYENPKIKEGVNYSREHPFQEFAQLVLGVLVLTFIVIALLHALSGYLVRFIPFEFEKNMVGDLDFFGGEKPSLEKNIDMHNYLQDLADKMIPHMDLPEGMTITMHYVDDDLVNALATLGGNVYFFKGLIDRLSSEDELAAVVGHEIAHIKHRHPLVALGKGVTIATVGAAISGMSGSRAGELLIGNSSHLSMLKFSRDQEALADETAMQGLVANYGHVGGALKLFQMFERLDREGEAPDVEVFRSHPFSAKRRMQVETLAKEKGWADDGEFTPLPLIFDR